MAFFKTIDLLKRNNASVLIEIVSEKDKMTIGKKVTGLVVTVLSLKLGEALCSSEDELLEYCETVKGAPPEILVEERWVPITRFFKDHRFVPKPRDKSSPEIRDKEFQQRQEKALVDTINQWNKPLDIGTVKIVRAEQAPEFGPHGKENLVDVVVWDETKFQYNVSCKMSKAADLGSGGIAGLQKTVPALVESIYYKVKYDLYGMGFEEGSQWHVNQVPTILYSIPWSHAFTIFKGSAELGGNIDFLYIGPDKVQIVDNRLNGDFVRVEEYAKKKPYYLRLRKRNVFNHTVKINFTKMNTYNLPCIFTSGPGDFSAARFVVDDRVPPKAIVREL